MAAEAGPRGTKRSLDVANASSDKKPTFDTLRENPIDVFVGTGSDSKRFHCFRPLLIRSGSAYFRHELADDSYLPRDPPYNIPVIDLPHEKPDDFSLFRQWMENERFFTHGDQVRRRKPYALARLFCFADRMGIPRLRNACINCLYMKANRLISQPTDEANSEESIEGCISSWKRAIRWVLSDTSICTDSSCLIRFLTDFFAFSVLQHVRLLEENLLSDLPAVFLEHVLDAVSTALARNAPGVPARSLHPAVTINIPSTTTTTTTITEQVDGKAITVIQIDDGDDHSAGEATPAPLDDTVVKTEDGHEIEVVTIPVKTLPKDKLLLPIFAQSAALRALSDGTWQRKEHRKKQGRQSKKNSDEANDEESPEGSQQGNDDMDHMDDEHITKASTKSFFGITNLCKYHFHSSDETRKNCARRFRGWGVKDVWRVEPSLRT